MTRLIDSLPYLDRTVLLQLIDQAFREDVGTGDPTSQACIPADAQEQAYVVAKANGVIAGMELVDFILKNREPGIRVQFHKQDGELVSAGDEVLQLEGNARLLLTYERLLLNYLQRMSGIATKTTDLVGRIKHTKARLLDTRKTTPNFRIFEKWAVKIGGGENHRFALYDQIMIKDNHIAYAGGIEQAIQAVNQFQAANELDLPVVVETRDQQEVAAALKYDTIHRILLDNMTTAQLREAVLLVDGRVATEASGGITRETITPVAETGVDYISVGALTHSYEALDLSMKAGPYPA